MIWIGLVIMALGALINFEESEGSPFVLFGVILIGIGSAMIFSSFHDGEPSAMDVYQGKTTLEITYKDGVPVDSVVVFKKN
jgi:hypothetical protein